MILHCQLLVFLSVCIAFNSTWWWIPSNLCPLAFNGNIFKVMSEWPERYKSRSKVVPDTPSHASDHLCLIWKESFQKCRSYKADMECRKEGRTDRRKPIYPPTNNFVVLGVWIDTKVGSQNFDFQLCFCTRMYTAQINWWHCYKDQINSA